MINIEGENFTPEEISDFLFEETPADPCTLKILPYPSVMDNDETSLLFEVLITIFMEGMMKAKKLYNILEENTSDNINEEEYIDVYNIQPDDLLICEPWFKSFGFLIFIEEFDVNNYIASEEDYCKIILKDDPNNSVYFNRNNITKPYHFILFSRYKSTNKLENIKALFHKPGLTLNSNKLYVVKFKSLSIDTRCSNNIDQTL